MVSSSVSQVCREVMNRVPECIVVVSVERQPVVLGLVNTQVRGRKRSHLMNAQTKIKLYGSTASSTGAVQTLATNFDSTRLRGGSVHALHYTCNKNGFTTW